MIKLATSVMHQPATSEEDVKAIEKLISEAYKEIDKAVSKGVLHQNNGARKKSRVARYKRKVLMAAGMFTPTEDHPDHKAFQKLQAKSA